jgi:hypothetical protein
VSQENGDLIVGKHEGRFGNPFLIRPLAEDAQFAKPRVQPARVPPIPVPADDKLVPPSTTFDQCDLTAEFLLGRCGNNPTVLV